MNKQREAVYGLRRGLIEGIDQKELITEDYVAHILGNLLDTHAPEKVHPDQWNSEALYSALLDVFGAQLAEEVKVGELNRSELGDALFAKIRERYEVKEQILGAPNMRYHERVVMLSVLDGLWKEHLLSMDHLKEGIGLRGYGQQDPLVAYKKESYDMFEAMMSKFQEDTVRHLFRMQILAPDGTPIETREQLEALQAQAQAQADAAREAAARAQAQAASQAASQAGSRGIPNWTGMRPFIPGGNRQAGNGQGGNGGRPRQRDGQPLLTGEEPGSETYPSEPPNSHAIHETAAVPVATTTLDRMERELEERRTRELAAAHTNGPAVPQEPANAGPKLGRNDDCFCGSGKKYKKCHGVNA